MSASLPFGSLHLGSLPLLSSAKTRSITAENPNGEVGGGAKAVPDENNPARHLGKGWKVRPCLELEPGSTTTIADIKGPGVIQHMWMTVDPERWRDIILRIYWDGEDAPSVEVPFGDFFCCGNNMPTKVNSLPIAVNPKGGCNSYWPMPFRKAAKITIESTSPEKIVGFFYQVTYSMEDVPADAAYFHAQWRRATASADHPEHTIIDNLKGQGHYVGTYILWQTSSDIWWGEGEVKFYMDGDKEYPTICGTGTEDYFGGAWGFYGEQEGFEQPFSTAFLGLPLVYHKANHVPKYGLYRWHIMDPIRFEKDLRVTIQTLGWFKGGIFQPLTDDLSSVAYWYQAEPHAPFPTLPDRFVRLPK